VSIFQEQTWIAYCWIFVAGLITGNLIKVMIYKALADNMKISFAQCPSCLYNKKFYELIPIFGFFITRGKCPSCSGKISVIYPTVEILNTCLYVLVYKLYGVSVETVGFCLLVSVLLLIAAIDFKTMFISNWSILLILMAGLIFALVSQEVSWLERVIGFISAGGILLIIAVITEGMGGGDVKLMAAVGFYLGWKLTLWSMLLAAVIGGLAGIVILASGKGKLKTEIPFGPILVVGIISSVLFGDEMIRWYLGLFLR